MVWKHLWDRKENSLEVVEDDLRGLKNLEENDCWGGGGSRNGRYASVS